MTNPHEPVLRPTPLGQNAEEGFVTLISGSRPAEKIGAWGHMTDVALLADTTQNEGLVRTYDFGPNLKEGLPGAYSWRKSLEATANRLNIPWAFTWLDRTFFRLNQTIQESIRPVKSTDRAEYYTQEQFFDPDYIVGHTSTNVEIKKRRRERSEVTFVFTVDQEQFDALEAQHELIQDTPYNIRSRQGGISCTMFLDILQAAVDLDFGGLVDAQHDGIKYTSGNVRHALRDYLHSQQYVPVALSIPIGEEAVQLEVYPCVLFKNGKQGAVIVNPHWRETDLEAVELVQYVHAAGYLHLPGVRTLESHQEYVEVARHKAWAEQPGIIHNTLNNINNIVFSGPHIR